MPPPPGQRFVNVSTQQLDYLVAVERHATWAAAAVALGVTPSALSQGLAELERRVGVRLFRPVGRGRELDPGAAPVLAYAERVVAQTRDLADWAEATRRGDRGTVRIGMIDVAAVHHHAAVLSAFRASRPDVDLHLTVAPSRQLLDGVLEGDLAFAVVVRPNAPIADLSLTDIGQEPLAVYGPPGSGPASSWGPWVSFPATSHTRSLIAAALEAAGQSFDVVAESHQPEVLRQMVELGMGWTVLPPIQAETEPRPLVPIRRRPLLSRTLALARRIDALADPTAEALAELIVASGPGGEPSTNEVR